MSYKSLLLAAGVASSTANLFTNNTVSLEYSWKNYVKEFGKKYADEKEERFRFQNFVDNLKIIDTRNSMEEGSAIHGINKFSDMSQDEFRRTFLGSVANKRGSDNVVTEIPSTTSSTSADWTGVYTTPVKDQGYCGSCWAFSATEQLESDYWRKTGTEVILSTEQVTQCAAGAFGCGGGWTETAYAYIKNEGGLETDANYPYTSGTSGQTGKCSAVHALEVVSLSSFTTISGSSTSEVETNMANYMLATGPLSVCVDANNWSTYRSGILTKCGQQVDHCVQAVGVNIGANGYWKVRNSWGTSWGESGYIRLAYGENLCAITNDATYVDATASN